MDRFLVIGALNMIDLVRLMQDVNPQLQLRYIGKNIGDYSTHPNKTDLEKVQVIAVFDLLPIHVAQIDTFIEVDTDDDVTMSA